ncbi:MAG: hypothetical protein WBK77_05825 [Alphaproteobacteria bacterium]
MQNIQQERAKLNFDLGDDEDAKLSQKEIITKKVHEISEKSGFKAMSAPLVPLEKSPPLARKSSQSTVRGDRRRRAKSGRTYPFNTKIKVETYDDICSLADAATVQENRPVSLAEIIERSVDALKKQGG